MWQNFIGELERTMNEIVQGVARFLPRFLEMLLLVVVGWIIAFVLRIAVKSVLRIARFDKLSEHTGAAQLLRRSALPPPAEMLSRFVFWVAWLGFILVGISVLPLPWLDPHISNFFGFLPRLVAASTRFWFAKAIPFNQARSWLPSTTRNCGPRSSNLAPALKNPSAAIVPRKSRKPVPSRLSPRPSTN